MDVQIKLLHQNYIFKIIFIFSNLRRCYNENYKMTLSEHRDMPGSHQIGHFA